MLDIELIMTLQFVRLDGLPYVVNLALDGHNLVLIEATLDWIRFVLYIFVQLFP